MSVAAHDLLARYALHHRDKRNITSNFVGVPMVVFAIGVLLSHPAFRIGGLSLSPAWVVFALATGWYLTRGELALGIATGASIAILMLAAHRLADGSLSAWLGWGFCMLMVGWLIQFVGYWYEGRKPAFVDDMVGLLVGPMFVTAEAMFTLGWNRPLSAEIERRAGPTVLRDMARIA